jgi:CRP-like cAMP-binding protein
MGPDNNRLLALLAAEKRQLLAVHFRTVDLREGQVLAEPFDRFDRVYFPYAGVISFSVPLEDGHLVQTGIVGRDGAVGALHVLDGKVSPNRIVVRVPGKAAVIEADRFSEIIQVDTGLRSLFLSHEQFFLAEVQQSAACNAVHSVQQKVCRWILRMNDLVGMNVPLTQELLSEMIAVRRTSISAAAAPLQSAGVISYRRGHIQIVDIERLNQSSCECYAAVKDHYDRIINCHS